MKKLIIALAFLCLPFLGVAQDCSKFIQTTTDKVTGESRTGTIDYLIVNSKDGLDKIEIGAIKANDGVLVSFYLDEKKGCVEKGGIINILFTDGSRLALVNKKAFNCDGRAFISFQKVFKNLDALQQLQTKSVEVLRIYTSDSYSQADFTPEQQEALKGILACLVPKK